MKPNPYDAPKEADQLPTQPPEAPNNAPGMPRAAWVMLAIVMVLILSAIRARLFR